MGGRPIRPLIEHYFVNNPDKIVSVQLLARSLRDTQARVRSGINSWRKTNGDAAEQVEVIVRGQKWRYNTLPADKRAPVPKWKPSPAEPTPSPSVELLPTTSTASGGIRHEIQPSPAANNLVPPVQVKLAAADLEQFERAAADLLGTTVQVGRASASTLQVGDMVEVVGMTKTGAAIARDTDGGMHQVSPL